MNVHPADLPSENGDKELKRPAPKGLSVNAELVFDVRHGKTFLARQLTPHPFHITRPFYFEEVPQGIASLYLQSSSGGLYGDDHLTLDIAVRKNAAAHVTTQASTVVHAARGGVTRNRVRIHVERGAFGRAGTPHDGGPQDARLTPVGLDLDAARRPHCRGEGRQERQRNVHRVTPQTL